MSAQPSTVAATGLPRPATVILMVLIPFGCGFYLSYLVRTVNAVISPLLTAEIGLTQANLGFLTGVYFITFAAMQLPLGVLLDRFGPRRVQTVLLVVAAAGSALFAIGESFTLLCVARGLIGIGVAGCLMASFKANAIWWPKDRLPLMNNIIGAFGSFGALSATVPVQAFLTFADWRALFFAMAALSLFFAAFIWAVVPERAGSLDKSARMASQFGAFGGIVKSVFFWRIALLLMTTHGTYLVYQTLWAGPWLREVAGLDERMTGLVLLTIQVGMFVGVIFSGVLADRLRRTRIRPRAIVVVGVSIYLAAQFLLALGVTDYVAVLWFVFGISGPVTFLCFSLFPERFPETQVARVTTTGNLVLFVFVFAAQWGIGAIIDMFDRAEVAAGHSTAFFVVFAAQFAALILFALPERRAAA